jgi:hypothetical protein
MAVLVFKPARDGVLAGGGPRYTNMYETRNETRKPGPRAPADSQRQALGVNLTVMRRRSWFTRLLHGCLPSAVEPGPGRCDPRLFSVVWVKPILPRVKSPGRC